MSPTQFFPLICASALLALPSCSSVKSASSQVGGSLKSVGSAVGSVGSAVGSVGRSVGKGISSLTGPDIDVVEVKESTLTKPLTGRERALAFERKQESLRQARVNRRRARHSSPPPALDDPVFDGLPSLNDLEIGGLLPEKPAS